MIEIIPSVLATSWHDFVEMVRKVEPFTDRIHLDILDGAFVGGQTIFGYEELQSLETKLLFDVHLMVMHPEQYVPQWLKDPRADRFFVHVEAAGRLADVLLQIRSQGKKAGLVINPETPTGAIDEFLDVIDYVQFMTVHPGRSGGAFLNDVIDKISTFHDLHPEMLIGVDGGMNPETVHMAYSAGAELIVSGSYIMKAQDVAKAMADLKDGLK